MRLLRSLSSFVGTRMNDWLLSTVLFVGLGYANALGQSTRGFELASTPPSSVSSGNYYALVIGIDDYPSLPHLTTAVHDAQAIGALFEANFGFKGRIVYLLNRNATRAHIMDALGGTRGYTQSLGESDNLVIYYAGHGYYDKRTDKAYWLPYDAESPLSPNHISSDDLTTAIRAISSRHVLVISDSCYSGDLTRGVDDNLPSAPGEQSFIKRMVAAPSRNLLASGGNEPVTDSGPSGHSIFAAALLRALAEQPEPIFTGADLADPVKKMVRAHAPQIPEYSRIGNSLPRDAPIDIGDFVFARTSDAGALSAVRELISENPARTSSSTIPVPTQPSANDEFLQGHALFTAAKFTEAAPILANASDHGSAEGCVDLGTLHKNGTGVEKSAEQAVMLYRKGCDGGSLQGCAHLARQLLEGIGVEKDPFQAAKLLRKTCDGGLPGTCTELGLMHENGNGVQRDLVQASVLYRKACESGNLPGCYDLALFLKDGTGLAKDPVQAAALLRKTCDGGYAAGCGILALPYLDGTGVERNPARSVELLRKACDGGDMRSCTNLGAAYLIGDVVPRNPAQASALFKQACDGNDRHGCVQLGESYENGLGVKKDFTLALALFQKGCDAGGPAGCRDLGIMYESGLGGTTRDMHLAIQSYRKGCEAHDSQSCEALRRLKR